MNQLIKAKAIFVMILEVLTKISIGVPNSLQLTGRIVIIRLGYTISIGYRTKSSKGFINK